MLSNLSAIPVHVNRYLCDGGKFLRWKRNHRKARINKKWHKRYGFHVTQCSKPVYEVGEALVCCPHSYEQLKRGCASEGLSIQRYNSPG